MVRVDSPRLRPLPLGCPAYCGHRETARAIIDAEWEHVP